MSMTFLSLQNEVINARFSEGKRTSVQYWLNLRYAMVWNAQDWGFTYKKGSLAVTGGTSSATLPADCLRAGELTDPNGTRIDYITPAQWEASYGGANVSTGSTDYPTEWTIVNGVAYLGPTPASTANYDLLYKMKFTALSADADVPLLPSEYHYMLVFGALASGLIVENDPTWEAPDQQFQQQLLSMAMSYASDWPGTVQYERDTFS